MEVLILTSLAFVFSIVLVSFHHYLREEPVIEKEIFSLLPGYNCGACGYVGCEGMVKAILDNSDNYRKCKPLKGEDKEELAAYLAIHRKKRK